jgi:uroporphyrinogen-III synthase
VLITRPEPGCAETAAAVAGLGWRPVLAPALALQSRPLPRASVQAMLITSRAAAASLPLGPPILAVGEASAAQARALGHRDVTAASGDAVSLAALARDQLRPADGPLLLAVGQGYALDLAAALRGAGFTVLRRVAYAARATPALPEAAAAALRGGLVGQALFLSPRSAETAIAQLRAAGLAAEATGIHAIAISPRVGRALSALPWRAISVADRPDHDAMLQRLGHIDTSEG